MDPPDVYLMPSVSPSMELPEPEYCTPSVASSISTEFKLKIPASVDHSKEEGSLQSSFESGVLASYESLSDSNSKSLDGSSFKAKLRGQVKRKKAAESEEKKLNRISQIISGVALKSKGELFKKLFKDVPGDEQLIIDYSCALHRDILVHGRLYLSQNWFCFYANIIGWETLVTLRWSDITAITKEKSARVIPNAIQMCAGPDKYFFTTFVTREHAFMALFRIWQNALLGHPLNPSELKRLCKGYKQKKVQKDADDDHDETGDEAIEGDEALPLASAPVSVDLTGEERCRVVETRVVDSPQTLVTPQDAAALCLDGVSQETSKPSRNDASTDSLENDADVGVSLSASNAKSELEQRPVSPFARHAEHIFNFARRRKMKKRKSTRRSSYHLNVAPSNHCVESTECEEDESDSSNSVQDNESIRCPCQDDHKGKQYANEEYNFDVDALYEHLFSQDSDFMKRVYDERKFDNWRYTPLERNSDGSLKQDLEYIMHLNYSVGPKTSFTKSTHIMHGGNKPGSYYVVDTENRSFGIPYADSFFVFTRYCLTRTAGNGSRLVVHGGVTYSKRVFGLVKNMINKNADEATKDYFDFLSTALRSESDLLDDAPLPIKTVSHKKKKVAPALSREGSKVNHRGVSASPEANVAASLEVESKALSSISADVFSWDWSKGFRGLIFTLLLLVALNVYLFGRLRSIENSVVSSKSVWLPKDLPSSKEEWFRLLEDQKHSHEQEMIKLKDVIGTTAKLVKLVESSISELHAELERSVTKREESGRIGTETGPPSHRDF